MKQLHGSEPAAERMNFVTYVTLLSGVIPIFGVILPLTGSFWMTRIQPSLRP